MWIFNIINKFIKERKERKKEKHNKKCEDEYNKYIKILNSKIKRVCKNGGGFTLKWDLQERYYQCNFFKYLNNKVYLNKIVNYYTNLGYDTLIYVPQPKFKYEIEHGLFIIINWEKPKNVDINVDINVNIKLIDKNVNTAKESYELVVNSVVKGLNKQLKLYGTYRWNINRLKYKNEINKIFIDKVLHKYKISPLYNIVYDLHIDVIVISTSSKYSNENILNF